jgi:isocitrate dehydrogenase (NAD+)
MMLEHLGERKAAQRLEAAVKNVMAEGKKVTPDLNKQSKAGTEDMAEAVCDAI